MEDKRFLKNLKKKKISKGLIFMQKNSIIDLINTPSDILFQRALYYKISDVSFFDRKI